MFEVLNKNSKNIVLNDPNELENTFINILSKREITNKELVLVGDFNINVLEQNVAKFLNLMFRHGLIPNMLQLITSLQTQ